MPRKELNINMIKAVLFDLDGTLVNSLQDLANATNYATAFFGVPAHDTEEFKYFVGDGIDKMIERAMPENLKDRETVSRARIKFHEFYDIHYADNTCTYNGMPQLVQKLKNMGIKVAVVTNKAEPAALEVVNRLYGDVFDLVFGQREGVPTKPDPTLTLMAMDMLGVSPQECVFIGDSGMDVKTGVNSGALPVGVLWGFRKAEELLENGAKHLIDHPEQLINIINQINR